MPLAARGYPATAAIATITKSIAPNVSGSEGDTPYSNPLIVLARIHEPIVPAPIPAAASVNVCINIRVCTYPADAPSAILIPISRLL